MSRPSTGSSRSWNAIMASREMIIDKVQDLLALEVMVSDIYKQALQHPESKKHQDALTALMNDELRHIRLVTEILDLL